MTSNICRNQFPTSPPLDGVKVAVVGEAPGEDEIFAGVPFVGRAGAELDKWLKPFFLRSQIFIGNLSQERPPSNKLQAWFKDKECTVPNDRLSGWIDVLKSDIESIKPNIIITLGRHPTYILTGSDVGWAKTKDFTWGSVLPSKILPNTKVIPMPHPAFVIRGLFDIRPLIGVWMRRAKYNSTFPEIKPPQRHLIIDPPLEQVMFELERLMEAKEIAFDIETLPDRRVVYEVDNLIYEPQPITCISFSDRSEWAISVPFSKGGHHRWTVEIEKRIWKQISRLLGRSGPLKIAHNLMFDFLQLAARRVFVAPPYWDTMTAHNRAYLDLTKKKLKRLSLNRLAVCTSLYTEEPFYKNDWKDENVTKTWMGADLAFWEYNAKDSAVLHDIKRAEERDLLNKGMLDMFRKEMRVFRPLAAMSLLGARREQEIVDNISNELRNEDNTGLIQTLQDELDKMVDGGLNTKSSQQMQKLLYSDLKLPIQYHKKTKRPTCDETAIAKLYQKTKHPILLKIKHLTRLRTFEATYIHSEISLDGRSRTTYNQARTSTARISSSDSIIGRGKNLQTIPVRSRPGEDEYNRLIKMFKKSFRADEGKILWKRDYTQAEAITVAYLAEDLQQIYDFHNNIDIHCRTVEILRDTPYSTVISEYKSGNPEFDHWRNVIAKPTRHGFNYRLGPIQLSNMFAVAGYAIPSSTCKRMLQTLAAGVPAVVRWQNEVEEEVRQTRSITNPFGLKRTFFGIIDDDAVREATAFVPQSAVGQMLNFAIDLIYDYPNIMEHTDLLLQIHDAVIGQTLYEEINNVKNITEKLMLIPMEIKGRELIIPTDLSTGLSWGELE